MSPTLKRYYQEKDRKKAFYIVQELIRENTQCPPVASTMIALEDDMAKISNWDKRERAPKTINTPMNAGIRINRSIVSIPKTEKEKKENEKERNKNKMPIRNRITGIKDGIKCPGSIGRWIDVNIRIIPGAVFN